MTEANSSSPSKQKFSESTLRKMDTMRKLTETISEEGMIKLSTLVPLTRIIDAIVSRDRMAFEHALADIRKQITEKKKDVSLQNLALIAEINFLEGFDTFISYINNEGEDEDEQEFRNASPADSMLRNSHPLRNGGMKHRPPKRTSLQPTEISKLDSTQLSRTAGEEREPRESRRKSGRYSSSNFSCPFDKCKWVLGTVKELCEHAESCVHKKSNLMIFRCSYCGKLFHTDKGVKSHIGHWSHRENCAKAEIEIRSVKKGAPELDDIQPSHHNRNTIQLKKEVQSTTQSQKQGYCFTCSVNLCSFASDSALLMYTHVKNNHHSYNTSFECECGEKRISGKAIELHLEKTCSGSKIKLFVHKKDDPMYAFSSPVKNSVNPVTPPAFVRSSAAANARQQWEVAFSRCPVNGCAFACITPTFIMLHVKKNHAENTIFYRCSKCKVTVDDVELIFDHCMKCIDSAPQAVVDGKVAFNNATRRRASRGSEKRKASNEEEIMTLRKRGRPSKDDSAKRGEEKGGSAAQIVDREMPVLEEFSGVVNEREADEDEDDDDVTVIKNEPIDDERVDDDSEEEEGDDRKPHEGEEDLKDN